MTKAERACQIWSILAWAARHRQTLTYGHLSQLTGIPAVGMGKYLDVVQAFCRSQKLPMLTSIVVQSDSGLPGEGFGADSALSWARIVSKVFSTDWLACGNPQSQGFEAHI